MSSSTTLASSVPKASRVPAPLTETAQAGEAATKKDQLNLATLRQSTNVDLRGNRNSLQFRKLP